ncbi:DUF3053 domain-containing protein [Pseudomonas sp. DWP3-1-2]|uniref:DUF3053 domain-containing protein n=1 Tax=Pseudomonas sp. DWP3-1-2 TaxID=2804645 RepID=UPI003CFA2A07
MKFLFHRHLLLALVLPLALAACGDKEPEQRAAFTQFLQTRIVDKPGVHVPKLTPDESKSFGDYAGHYAIITDFNSGMDSATKPLEGLIQKGAIRSVNDVLARRDEIKAAQVGLTDMVAQLSTEQAKADAAHAQLKQPAELKVVYDKAYERTVTLPATALLEVVPQVNSTLDSGVKIADYINAHKAQIDVSGVQVAVSDPKVQAELNGMLQDLNAQAKQVQEAQRRMQSVVYGR